MKTRVLVLASLLVMVLSLVPLHSYADAPNALSISPDRKELAITAGETDTSSLSVTNTTNQPLLIDMYSQTFFPTDPSYDYSFQESSALNQWVHFNPSSFTLSPQQSQKVNYSIGIPANATPGGKYFSLFAATTNQENPKGITTSERVGSLLYVTVPGDTSHKGALLGLNVTTVAFSAINWSEKINNTGANYFRSYYTVSLTTPWGSTVESNSDSALIISSSIRLVSGQLAAPRWIGLYKVNATFSLGDSGSATNSRWVLYLPISQVLLLLVLIAAIIYGIRRLKRRHKRKKKQDD